MQELFTNIYNAKFPNEYHSMVENLKYLMSLNNEMILVDPKKRPSCTDLLRSSCLANIHNEVLNIDLAREVMNINFSFAKFINNLRMANFFYELKILSKVPSTLKYSIKYYHVFRTMGSLEKRSALFVTDEDKVYGYGVNSHGHLGQGHNSQVDYPEEILELRGKGISEFYIGPCYVCALGRRNQLYTWGKNDHGQLGIGMKSERNEYFKPNLIKINFVSKIKQVNLEKTYIMVV